MKWNYNIRNFFSIAVWKLPASVVTTESIVVIQVRSVDERAGTTKLTDEYILDFDSFILSEEDIEGEVGRFEESGTVRLWESRLGYDISFH